MSNKPIDTRSNILEAAVSVFAKKGYHESRVDDIVIQAVGLGALFEERRQEINHRFTHIIQDWLDRAVFEGSIAPIQTDLVARVWVGALNKVVVNWIYTGKPDLEKNYSCLTHNLTALHRDFGHTPHTT